MQAGIYCIQENDMKKSKNMIHTSHRPSWRAIAVITWLVVLTALTALSALWSWDAIKIASQGDFNEYSRLVRGGMEDSFRQPVVSASEGVFVLPEIDMALPYEDTFYNLRYNAYTDNGFQEASFTTSNIITASTQPKGGGRCKCIRHASFLLQPSGDSHESRS